MTGLASAAFYNCTALTQVTLPSTLETIGNDAFAGCAALQTLTLPGGLKSIGSRAFQGCTALQAVEDGLVRIFREDEELTELDAPLSLPEGATLTFIRLTFLTGRMW
jgi:hypothetical protein